MVMIDMGKTPEKSVFQSLLRLRRESEIAEKRQQLCDALDGDYLSLYQFIGGESVV